MPFLTNEDIEEREKSGARMTHLNQGWNLQPKTVAKIAAFLKKWKPETETEKRDKHILQLAFIEDMNASQIARLNDPVIVGAGNRSRGKPLSPGSILKICYKYFPEAKERKYKGKSNENQRKRTELYQTRQKGEISKLEICATCGTIENIELHHIIPLTAGGTNDYFNLVYMCHDCHMKLHHLLYDKLEIF